MANVEENDIPGVSETILEELTRGVEVAEVSQTPNQHQGTFSLFPGEELKLRDLQDPEVECIDPSNDGRIRGQLKLTNYRLFFTAAEGDPHDIDIPIHSIQAIDKRYQSEKSYILEIKCKHFLTVQFTFDKNERKKDLYSTLMKTAFIDDGGRLFAFDFKRKFKENGWEVYNFENEYKRLGAIKENSKWRVCTINKGFALIDSYPEYFVVPASVSDETVKKTVSFRSKGRVPALSWLHPKNEASITRCSQPCVGIRKHRCEEDETMIAEIRKATTVSTHIHICDCRPAMNAKANMAKGCGYETPRNYENIEFSFGNIENIHAMRDSNNKLRALVTQPEIDETKWFSNLAATQWLSYVQSVLNEAVRVASTIENKRSSVVIHCSDGWDRTSQISSLSMILLDPYYRTLQGFEVLIEKEWLSFGHMFRTRTCHGSKTMTDNYSPIFLQFIDCVWQIGQLYPHSFEFNNNLLLTIAQHLHSCLFGTFLYDCDKQRKEMEVKTKTVSLWSYINTCKTRFLNPLYREKNECILPVISMRTIRLWKQYWMAYHPYHKFEDPTFERTMELVGLREKIVGESEEARLKNQAANKNNVEKARD